MVQGYGLMKKDYQRFSTMLTRARKKRRRGWAPYTLTDETRKIYNFNDGFSSLKEWIDHIRNRGIKINLDKHLGQKYLVQVWFEAQAMFQQFAKYTKPYYVTLVPFRGDLSLPMKWKLSQQIREALINDIPVKILYFGDLDKKGLGIPESAVSDIREWTAQPEHYSKIVDPIFDFIRVGLNPEHVSLYDIPENPQKPGDYQWEALDDAAAAELITTELNKHIDLDKIQTVLDTEKQGESLLLEYLKKWDLQ